MKSFVYALIVAVAFVHMTMANFDIYRMQGHQDGNQGSNTQQPDGWQVYSEHHKDCHEVNAWQWWWPRFDVSGSRLGVVCQTAKHKKGCNIGEWPWPDIKRLEMHFCKDPYYHFTIYKDKGRQEGETWYWTLYDTRNHKKGECFAYGGLGYDCWYNGVFGWLGKRHIWGSRKFRCITDYRPEDFLKCHKMPEKVGGVSESDFWVNGTGVVYTF
ncbi:hypothetical protein GRF29_28g2842243 [Pseudopithomyces chartarum]|uniref:Secreted protein n=1 Tax=Pseudopithomyces chartarum TaxID=1892770 RepID=A0AAN6M244_9PLEO|nr:hypothetical protein GRF29_28g2842243 [Pseudopithomyces chartarum]